MRHLAPERSKRSNEATCRRARERHCCSFAVELRNSLIFNVIVIHLPPSRFSVPKNFVDRHSETGLP